MERKGRGQFRVDVEKREGRCTNPFAVMISAVTMLAVTVDSMEKAEG